MDAAEVFIKRPGESLPLYVNFSKWLLSGEELTGTPEITPETDSGLEVESISQDGTKVHAVYSGGTPRLEPWCINITATVTDGADEHTRIACVSLRVLPAC